MVAPGARGGQADLRGAEDAGQALGDEPGPLLVAGQDVAEAAAAGQGVVEGQVGPAGDAGQGGDPLPFEQADDEVCAGQLHGSAPGWGRRRRGKTKNPRRSRRRGPQVLPVSPATARCERAERPLRPPQGGDRKRGRGCCSSDASWGSSSGPQGGRGHVKSVADVAGCVNQRGEDLSSSLKAEKRGGVSDLSTQGSRLCYRKLYGQLASNAPFPAP